MKPANCAVLLGRGGEWLGGGVQYSGISNGDGDGEGNENVTEQ